MGDFSGVKIMLFFHVTCFLWDLKRKMAAKQGRHFSSGDAARRINRNIYEWQQQYMSSDGRGELEEESENISDITTFYSLKSYIILIGNHYVVKKI